MHMSDLFDMDLYWDMVNRKYIRINRHNDLPIYILNYTEQAQYDNEWNEVTRQCRGLIVDDYGNVIARPYDKFLNYGQPGADPIGLDDQVDVTDKLDGSLGILWEYKGHVGIATRGSFHSEQAEHATKIWHEKYAAEFGIPSTYYTMMFEIIYPSNRIVLDYDGLDDIILIGARDIKRGSSIPAVGVTAWRWKKVRAFHYHTLREALEAPPRPNAEGYVVHAAWEDYRIKIKQEDYIQLHRIVTGLTERRIWENMKEGKTLFDLLEIVPDEWHEWLSEVHDKIHVEWCQWYVYLTNLYADLRQNIPKDFPRIDFNNMLDILDAPEKGMMFKLFDGDSINQEIWKRIRPSAE